VYITCVVGDEWDYVILSTVRSLPEYEIDPRPSYGWCSANMGFICDSHQINVALTRAHHYRWLQTNLSHWSAVVCDKFSCANLASNWTQHQESLGDCMWHNFVQFRDNWLVL